jgi:hypothetical protein
MQVDHRAGRLSVLFALSVACGKPPPPSLFPDGEAALGRMHATYACSRGIGAEAKLDYIGPSGRIRGNVLYLAAKPARLRLDLFSPFGAVLSTLTSDGAAFRLADIRQREFFRGPANACNMARFTRIALPPGVLVDLFRGEAPVLKHQSSPAQGAWEGGRYVVRVAGAHGAVERIELEPVDADFKRPWNEQRVRVLGIAVEQQGVPLYSVTMAEHAKALTAPPRVDPDGIDPPMPPSGPACEAELPRRLHIEVPAEEHDLVIAVVEASHNPPLPPGVFTQEPEPSMRTRISPCVD